MIQDHNTSEDYIDQKAIPEAGVMGWIEERLPVFSFFRAHLVTYPTPKNLSFMWNWGSLAGLMLVIMILTGVFLAMHYDPSAARAFASVERIMRDVNYGWLLRYLHMNGASLFFIAVYMHMLRSLYYGSFKKPRELLWMMGVLILLMMMATAFMGYVLPWGQMSYWGATVITNLFSALPFVGEQIVQWLWGGFSVGDPTLNRFFVLHFLFPFLMIGVVGLHLMALHQSKSNNPTGVEPTLKETIPFHPYYTVKDFFGIAVFGVFYASIVFFAPDLFGEPDNYIEANPLVTPPHIVPEWYFLPFYAILRAIPNKLGGVIAMFGAILVLFFLPWLDRHPVKSGRYRPWFKICFWVFCADCIFLGWVGAHSPEGVFVLYGRLGTGFYYAFFLGILPLLSWKEKAHNVPTTLSEGEIQKKQRLKWLKKYTFWIMLGLFVAQSVESREISKPQPPPTWSFEGPLGTYDRAQLQRGFQVYKEVCSTCHGLQQVTYGDLQKIGFTETQAKVLAAEVQIPDTDDSGNPIERPGRLNDFFKEPFANEKAARAANNGALPPDQSLIVKARKEGVTYLYELLTGYVPTPAGFNLPTGKYYNAAFPDHAIGMSPPLTDHQVVYADGAPSTVNQMAKDVAAFLAWSADPFMEDRKRMGIRALLFLGGLAILLYLVMHRIWGRVEDDTSSNDC